MNVSEAIRTKRAIRQYTGRTISQENVEIILNAGRRAQSAKNNQPWRFIAIRDKKILVAISKLGTWAGHLAGAALGVAITTPAPEQRFSILFDAGQATAYMQLAAWQLGIGSCLATIYETEIARELLGFPEDMHIRIAISFGYHLDESLINAPPQKGGRRSLEDIVKWEYL